MEHTDVLEQNEKCINGTGSKVTDESLHGWGYRHLQILLMFYCLMSAYSIRTCMGVALLAICPNRDLMKNFTGWANNDSTTQLVHDNITWTTNSPTASNKIPTFDWDKTSQDIIQSAFFWGYMLLQVPGGMLAHRLGGKFLLVTSLFINAALSICIPWATIYGGFWGLLVCRASQGLTQSVIVPSLHTLLGKWAPPHERSRMTVVVYGGVTLGVVMGMSLSGFMAMSSLGWPLIFWSYGTATALAALLFYYTGAESPARHPNISSKEKQFIHMSIHNTGELSEKRIPVPWSHILKSKGMWAIVASHISDSWGQYTIFSQIPAYISNIMRVDIGSNGLLTALPFLMTWCVSHFYSSLADFIIRKKLLSVTNVRKLANSIGCFPTAVALASLTYIPAENLALFEFILVVICMLEVAIRVGYQVNPIDIAPNFSGTMISISNFISNVIGSFAPIMAAYMVKDSTQQSQWHSVFIMTATIYFCANLIFITLGTAERASWNDLHAKETELASLRTETTQKRNTNIY